MSGYEKVADNGSSGYEKVAARYMTFQDCVINILQKFFFSHAGGSAPVYSWTSPDIQPVISSQILSCCWISNLENIFQPNQSCNKPIFINKT